MSARMSNPSSAAPPAVPVLCPSPGLDLPPSNPEGTVGFHQEFLGKGVGPVPSGSRVPFPLAQSYVRDSGSIMSADAQVPPVVVEVPAHQVPGCISFAPSASASRPHHKFSQGLWLLYPRFSIVWVFAFIGI